MKLMLLHHTPRGLKRYPLTRGRLLVLALFALVVFPGLAVLATLRWVEQHSVPADIAQMALKSAQMELAQARQEVEKLRRDTQLKLEALNRRFGALQGEIMRINAVGKRLLDVAGIDTDEFDFESVPQAGGPEHTIGSQLQADQLTTAIEQTNQLLSEKGKMISVLESVLMNRELDIERYISGRPVVRGWNSSKYGKRIDPITGNPAWHEGMDFAGKLGDPIVATASGVVSFVGQKWGYGLTVEISHGNGIVTRYGHNQKILVKPGQIVQKGQQIATMGSSGRSTGPHVHYEVLVNGRAVDPKKYVWRREKNS